MILISMRINCVKDLQPGQELFYDYGNDYNRDIDSFDLVK